MEFCMKCGNELNGERFCTKCGAENRDMVNSTVSQNSKKHDFKLKKFIFIPIIVMVAIVVYFVFNSGRTCDDVASAVVNAEFGCTSREVVAKYADVLPEQYFNYIVDEGKDWLWNDKEGWIDYQYEENYSDNSDKYISRFGENYKYSYKIVDEVEYDKEALADYSDDCKEYNIVPKAAKDVTIEVRVTGNDTGNDYSLEVTMIKIGNSWYLLDI